MTKISHTEPSQHYNSTHWSHMEQMKWFSSAMLGVLAVNTSMLLAWLWLKSAKLLSSTSATGVWHDQNHPHRAL
jgi:hypothetical protein